VAAKPYDSWSLMAQGVWLAHAKAEPPSHPDLALKSRTLLLLASQAKTGWLKEAFPGHEHDGLQQSQYL